MRGALPRYLLSNRPLGTARAMKQHAVAKTKNKGLS